MNWGQLWRTLKNSSRVRSLDLMLVGGPRIQPLTRRIQPQSLGSHLSLTHGQSFPIYPRSIFIGQVTRIPQALKCGFVALELFLSVLHSWSQFFCNNNNLVFYKSSITIPTPEHYVQCHTFIVANNGSISEKQFLKNILPRSGCHVSTLYLMFIYFS
jgi:hypothetical protein